MKVQEVVVTVKNKVLTVHPISVVFDHLLGEKYPTYHKVTVGLVIMTCGVSIAKIGGNEILHFTNDLIGYAIHAIGGTPIIEYLLKLYKK